LGVTVLGLACRRAPARVAASGASPAVADQAVSYLRISLLGRPSMLIVLAGTGVLRGLQDTVTPLAVSVGSFALNAALNAWFVLGQARGIAGSALRTVAAQTIGAAVYRAVVIRCALRLRMPRRPDPACVLAAR